MAKVAFKSNPRVHQIFDDLDSYLDFCKSHGYIFDERDLYSNKSYVYRQFTKFITGKPVKDMWEIDVKGK